MHIISDCPNIIHIKGILIASLHSNGIIEIVWDTDITLIETEHLLKAREAIFKLGKGEKMPVFFSTHDFIQSSPEGQSLAITEEYTQYTLAVAVLINSFALRMSMLFFNRLYKPKVPTKGFNSKAEAFTWLLKKKISGPK
jgi:hypothetical protein